MVAYQANLPIWFPSIMAFDEIELAQLRAIVSVHCSKDSYKERVGISSRPQSSHEALSAISMRKPYTSQKPLLAINFCWVVNGEQIVMVMEPFVLRI